VLFSSPLLLAQLYRDHRDAILALFWENPERDLTFAEVRQHIDGEVNGLMR
jgi:DNA-binding SARP family transcriptional activator